MKLVGGHFGDVLDPGSFRVDVVDYGCDELVTVFCHGKARMTCKRSLFFLSIDCASRKALLSFIHWKPFDRFILLCIVVNSIVMAVYKHRAPAGDSTNEVCAVIGRILTWIFLMECALKISAMGFVLDRKTYLRDPWNVLDFVVVLSAVAEMIPYIPTSSLNFLRLLRVLRPLRSLNSIPEMKALVSTTISAVPKLTNVGALGLFIGVVFAVIGMTLFQGVFYRQCRETPMPALVDGCWEWNFSADAAGLCGGEYLCADVGGYCFGHEVEQGDLKPRFPDGMKGPLDGGPPWCEGSAPIKLFPETDFVHFDHLGGALLLIFQSMTMEGWTTFMYYIQDSVNLYVAYLYFVILIITLSFFLLNVALAVVDEARDDFSDQEDEEEDSVDKSSLKLKQSRTITWEREEPYWCDCYLMRRARALTRNDQFANFVTLVIAGNVITMMMDTYPPVVSIQQPKDWVARVFLFVFVFEMFAEVLARGPLGYLKNQSTAFDGLVVIVSLVEEGFYITGGKAGGFKALRTLRLFRVLNKFASRSPALKILLKSMIETAKALRYWLVLFLLVLYLFTLMWMHFFANQYHFQDPTAMDVTVTWPPDQQDTTGEDGTPWCPPTSPDSPFATVRTDRLHYGQDCIPRSHFDNFGWGFVTIFQVMTGENWNTVMYAGMRAGGWGYGFFYVILILFGQTLFLSLFLSMLLSKFDEFKTEMEEAERASKQALSQRRLSVTSVRTETPETRQELGHHETDAPLEQQFGSTTEPTMQHDESLPGQMPPDFPQSHGSPPESRHSSRRNLISMDTFSREFARLPSSPRWPMDYSWFIMHTSNPIRRAANYVLNFRILKPGHPKTKQDTTAHEDEGGFAVVDSFIMACILLSTVCMMIDVPLADPQDPVIAAARDANTFFVVVFIIEMIIKLLAYPVFWGKGAYLHDGWNWLDGLVVLVSIITTLFPKGPTFLKTLRILRALRPLRVIQRAKSLRMVVETIFKSMKELGVLLIVFLIFLLIFSLLFMMYLSGMFYKCEETEIVFLKDVNLGNVDVDGVMFTMPLCLGNDVRNASNQRGSMARGYWNETHWVSQDVPCPDEFPNMWQRATADTPICVGRCDPFLDVGDPGAKIGPMYRQLCPRRYTTPEELPSRCDDPDHVPSESEQVGIDYVAAMQAWYTLPCGGSTPESAAAGLPPPMGGISCREAFCGDSIDEGRRESCKSECDIHPFHCATSCDYPNKHSPECLSCKEECRATCECDFCTPLIKDAALCHEQGSNWVPVIQQNFNNVWNSMLTLMEISTTEGWVDVMDAAADTTDNYVQPVRDTNHVLWMLLFVLWIFLSNMFLMNLGVGVIVDKFMDERERLRDVTLTRAQAQWIRCREALARNGRIFDIQNLHLLPKRQRQFYNFVKHPICERTIMTCIVINTLLMTVEGYPELETPATSGIRAGKEALNIFFATVFTIEAILKILALRLNYWKDSWNRFDFFLVSMTVGGIILDYSTDGINVSSVASVVRIFRIARLFRLLKFKPLRPLNKLFTSLAVSLVKLVNVGVVAGLFLILFSILGVNLFSMSSQEEANLDNHANFKNFLVGCLLLFRAATGEAWNSVMHDLHKDEMDFFLEGRWCTPADLYDWHDSYDILKDKCLIQKPNACVFTFWGWNPLPWLYWTSYTFFIGLVIMNIIVAVILEGYDEAKSCDEAAILDTCKTLWERKYDPDHRMILPPVEAVRYILEAMKELQSDGLVGGDPFIVPTLQSTSYANQLRKIPMRYAKAFDLVVAGNHVEFFSAVRQVFRFVAVVEDDTGDPEIVNSLDEADDFRAKRKDLATARKQREEEPVFGSAGSLLVAEIAASKLQQRFRNKKRTRLAGELEAACGTCPPPQTQDIDPRDVEPLQVDSVRDVEPQAERPPVLSVWDSRPWAVERPHVETVQAPVVQPSPPFDG